MAATGSDGRIDVRPPDPSKRLREDHAGVVGIVGAVTENERQVVTTLGKSGRVWEAFRSLRVGMDLAGNN